MGAIFLEVFDGLVESSSLVRGSGMLQYGIRETVVAWSWIDREYVVKELIWASEGHEE